MVMVEKTEAALLLPSGLPQHLRPVARRALHHWQAHLTGGGYGRLLIDTHFGQNLCHASVMIFLPISFR